MSEHNSALHLKTTAPTATGVNGIRRRSAVACKNCNLRKVRCNVASSGPPCANCQHDKAACEILPRKKHGPKRKQLQATETQGRRETRTRRPMQQPDHGSPLAYQTSSSLASPPSILAASQLDLDPPLSEPNLLLETPKECLSSTMSTDEAENSSRYAVTLDADVAQVPEGNPSMVYIGDRQGASNFVFDLCNGLSQTSHYLVPHVITTRSQRPEDLAYLRLKGCFSVPSQDICEDLIRAYFLHVHPFLPIIDASQFLDGFNKLDYRNINLLLLWSVFFAATNFVEVDVFQRAGYTSRKAMKRAMYQRAKVLYDSDYEEDKLSLIQSVILMAFWYSDMEDRTGAWHWIGIAISLCQTLGLHRNPREDVVKRHVSTSLLRRIWWSCFVRDCWLSLSMGRPMRIQVEDCDALMPTVEDVVKGLGSIPRSVSRNYLPNDPDNILARLWINFLKISQALGNLIRALYRLKGAKPDLEAMKKYEEDILECAPTNEEKEEPSILLHIHQLRLFYETAIIVLHRPYLLQATDQISSPEETSWQVQSRRKAKAAATNINTVLEKLIDMDMIKFLKPMSVTTLIPAMQMHLLESTSPSPLLRNFGSHKLKLCMMVLSELRATYWGADSIYRLFERAEAKLLESRAKHAAEDILKRSTNKEHVVPLTPESSNNTQIQPEAARTFLNSLVGPDEFLWDQSGLDAIMNGSSFTPYDLAFAQDRSETFAADLSPLGESMQVDSGINTLLSLEEFNNQCLYMGQPR